MSSIVCAVVWLAGTAVLATSANQPMASGQDQPIFKSSVRTVPIYATVVDSSGRLVPDLERADFSILDNAKPAEVSLFSNDSQPFSAVVMLDTSASMTANLKLLNRAAEQFLLRLLPVDRAQVGAFNDKIQLSGTFTNNRAEGHRRPSRRPGIHRWRRHVEPDRLQGRARAGPRRRSDGLLDWVGVGVFQRHARGQDQAVTRPSEDFR